MNHDLFLTKVLDDLKAGTEYSIILSACTGGGCTNSSMLNTTTLESLPLVDDINLKVVNKSSIFLALEWNEPNEPNGKIRKYILFMNAEIIYEGSFSYSP